MSRVPPSNRDFIVREVPKTIAIDDSKLIFTSGNIVCMDLREDFDEPKLLVDLVNDNTWYFNQEEAIKFISQFPREYFAKTPKLAELHRENQS